ncbi:MAG: dihydrodipicolinate synthase family protein [Armatimonadetes bacterium]|nr:dihydrodipicolinate synthase family protein [Armatimonadota bacterium]
MPELKGVFNITATPFADDGKIDEADLRRLVEFQLKCGAHGLTILGIMGEAHKLSESERQRVTEVVVEQVNGRVPVVVGTSHPGADVAAALSRHAEKAGAAAVMVAPSFGLQSWSPGLMDYYRRVADRTGLPIVVQDEPVNTGVLMPAATLARICDEIPSATYIKLEEMPTPPKISQILKLSSRKPAIFGGWGGIFFLEELRRGAAGTMTGFAFTEVLVGIYERFIKGDLRGAKDLFYRYVPLIRFENQPGIGLAIRKEILKWRGAMASAVVRAPGPRLDPETRQELFEMLEYLGAPQAAGARA